MSPMYRIGTKLIIDATKPAVTQTDERARFDPAMPFGHDRVKFEDFLS